MKLTQQQNSTPSPTKFDDLTDKQKAIVKLQRICLSSFEHYCRWIDQAHTHPPHIAAIAEKLEAVARGEITRLIINIPPRHGKSETVSKKFVSWFLAKNPGAPIILSSYGVSLAKDFSRWVKNAVQTKEFKTLSPLRLSADSYATEKFETIQGGSLAAVGVGGPALGRGAKLAVIDDPIKNASEAKSLTIQRNLAEWYRSVLRTRMEPGGAIVVVMQRWNAEDFTAQLLEQGEDWHVLKLPAEREDGSPLWPERYTREELAKLKAAVGVKTWLAMYQQEPQEVTGDFFPPPQMIDDNEVDDDLQKIAFFDPAYGGSNYNALAIYAKQTFEGKPARWIVYGFVWLGNIDVSLPRLCSILGGFKNVGSLYVESNKDEGLFARALRKFAGFAKLNLPVKDKRSKGNKHVRIQHFVLNHWPELWFSTRCQAEFLRHVLQYEELREPDDAPDSMAGLGSVIFAKGKPKKTRMI